MARRVPALSREGMGGTGRTPKPAASSVSPSAASEEEEGGMGREQGGEERETDSIALPGFNYPVGFSRQIAAPLAAADRASALLTSRD